jgi:hypothetical protein
MSWVSIYDSGKFGRMRFEETDRKENIENASTIYTLKTRKHMEARHVVRQNYEGVGVVGDPIAEEKLKIPDIQPEDETKTPFYRLGSRAAFLVLLNLRLACLYV